MKSAGDKNATGNSLPCNSLRSNSLPCNSLPCNSLRSNWLKYSARITALFVSCLLTGCLSHQLPPIEPLPLPDRLMTSSSSSNPHLVMDRWWENFGDAHLNEIVERALKNSPTLQLAQKSIELAQISLQEDRGALLPTLSAGYTQQESRGSALPTPTRTPIRTYPTSQLYGTVSYELDLWGKNRFAIDSAACQVQGAVAQQQIAQLTLVSSLISTYYNLQAIREEIDNQVAQLAIDLDIDRLTQARVQAGLDDLSTFEKSQQAIGQQSIDLEALRVQQKQLLHALAYLCGEYPESFQAVIGKEFTSDPCELLPASLPSQLLIQRPDIRAALAQLQAAGYDQLQADAALLPSINLTANGGFASQELSHLLSNPSLFWNLSLNLLQPLLNASHLKAQSARAKSERESALISYRDTLLLAFREVEDALIAYQSDSLSLALTLQIQESLISQQILSRAKLESGLIGTIEFLNAKAAELEGQQQIRDKQLQLLQDLIQVYKAMGAGFLESKPS